LVVVTLMSSDDLDMALRIASDVLDGKLDIISGCRRVLSYRSQIRGVSDEAWDVVTAIASETDDIPLGDVRNAWDPGALATRDAEAAEYIERVRPAAREAFGEIVRVVLGG